MNWFSFDTEKATVIIALFFLGHWFTSAFSQTFFLHRYGAHGMFTMNRFWERFFYLMTFFTQGSSFLNPRAYAIMHRMHHAHSDTEKDPHSPHFFEDVFSMMWQTKNIYQELRAGKRQVPNGLRDKLPEWTWLDDFADKIHVRLGWCTLYTLFYFAFAPSAWFLLLLPVHFLMGPVHGAAVNWCGHKYGYRNFAIKDHSKNTFFADIFFMGELFQNNHHRYPKRPRFAVKWFEFDVTYVLIKSIQTLGIIQLNEEVYAQPTLKNMELPHPTETQKTNLHCLKTELKSDAIDRCKKSIA